MPQNYRRKKGYYWIKWSFSTNDWSVVYWSGRNWYAINSEVQYVDGDFETISQKPIPEPDN